MVSSRVTHCPIFICKSEALSVTKNKHESVSILVVDDTPASLAAICESLQPLGQTVVIVTASSGEDALRHLLTQDFALAIVDIMMPRMNGYELAAAIRGRENSSHLPIIFMTATYEDEEHTSAGYDAGAVDYLYKPIKPYLLRAKVATFVDIYRRTVALEEAVLLLEKRSAQLDAFAYSAAHDLRAPLTHIQGFSKLLMGQGKESLPPDEREYLNQILSATHDMTHLINAIMSLSEVQRVPFSREKIDLAPIAGQSVRKLQEGEERSVEVVIPDRLPAEANPYLMKVLFNNLIGNAWKFTRRCGKPRIEVGAVSASDQSGEKTTYFVKDNGVGFDMKQAVSLFLPFSRLHPKHEFPGSGVGLATVHRIIEKHGGTIWTESEVGQGATFYFTLR
jgi:signal transduction histidine kinase